MMNINEKITKKIIAGIVIGGIAVGGVAVGGTMLHNHLNNSNIDPNSRFDNLEPDPELEEIFNECGFNYIGYNDGDYISLTDSDARKLIQKAMEEVDKEYSTYGDKVSSDNESFFKLNATHVKAILNMDSGIILAEVVDPEGNIYDGNNLQPCYEKDKNGENYYGLTTMNEETLNAIIEDRKNTLGFKDASLIVGGKKFELTLENLEPATYIKAVGATTKEEVKEAVFRCFMANAQLAYIQLNNIVRNNLREGVNDANIQLILNCEDLAELTDEEKVYFVMFLAKRIGFNNAMQYVKNGNILEEIQTNKDLRYALSALNYYRRP